MRQLVITIGKTGDVNIDAQGFKGHGCKDATKVFEDALGAAKVDSQEKPEIYMTEDQRVSGGY